MSTMHSQDQTQPGPVAGPVCGVVTAVFVALLCRNVPAIPLWAPAAVAVPGAAATWWYVAVHRGQVRHARKNAVFLVSCWLFSASWSTWTAWQGFSAPAVIVLVAAAVPAGFLAHGLAPKPVAGPAAVAMEPVPMFRSEHPKAAQLKALLNSMLKLAPGSSCTIKEFEMWRNKAGYTAVVEFPRGQRVTLRKVQDLCEDLAAELQLTTGGSIHVAGGDHHAAAVIKVTESNNFDKPAQYPTTYTRRSDRGPIQLGEDGKGDPAEVDPYATSQLYVAKPGGGKTTLLHNVIAEVAQRDNLLIWVVDMNGGGAAMPWLLPYARDEVDNPVIDYVADTDEKAFELSEAALAIALDRKSRYAPLLIQQNTDVLPVTSDIPGILIIVDEGGECFGTEASMTARRAAANFEKIARIGRAMRVRLIYTSLRATADYMSSSLKKNTSVAMCGQVQGDDEIGLLFGDWAKGVTSRDLTGPGQFWLRVGEGRAVKIQTRHLLPEQIGDIARVTAAWRPTLDAPSRRAAGAGYASRWDRVRGYLRNVAGLDDEGDDYDAPPSPASVRDEPFVTKDDLEALRLALAAERATVAAAPLAAEADPAGADEAPQWVEEAFAWVQGVENGGDFVEPSAATPSVDGLTSGQRFVYQFILQAGPDGTRTMEIYEAAKAAGEVGDRRATVSEWNAQLAARGLIKAHPTYASWVATVNALS